MRDAQEMLRAGMIEQALALSDGNRSEAARLLQVSRQAVQQQLRERDGSDDDGEPGRRAP